MAPPFRLSLGIRGRTESRTARRAPNGVGRGSASALDPLSAEPLSGAVAFGRLCPLVCAGNGAPISETPPAANSLPQEAQTTTRGASRQLAGDANHRRLAAGEVAHVEQPHGHA